MWTRCGMYAVVVVSLFYESINKCWIVCFSPICNYVNPIGKMKLSEFYR